MYVPDRTRIFVYRTWARYQQVRGPTPRVRSGLREVINADGGYIEKWHVYVSHIRRLIFVMLWLIALFVKKCLWCRLTLIVAFEPYENHPVILNKCYVCSWEVYENMTNPVEWNFEKSVWTDLTAWAASNYKIGIKFCKKLRLSL